MKVSFIHSMEDISEDLWNSVVNSDYPFLKHAFLRTLEKTRCVGRGTGWLPFHLQIKNEQETLAVMPLYLKTDSHGEFIFDWSWADAFYRNGIDYYPKLVSAIPFTPVQGPRLCLKEENRRTEITKTIKEEIEILLSKRGLSSMHILLPNAKELETLKKSGFSLRTSYSFHWFNNNYQTFDDFLLDLTSRQRKNIKKERLKILNQKISITRLSGNEISTELWSQFYKFYEYTYLKRGMRAYLNLDFFLEISSLMPDSILLLMAKDSNHKYVAGALNFLDSENLYGRYWGCEEEYDSLHFEACYYQGIEFCIEKGLKKFDPGVQGEHKIKRGFRPIETYSAHWIKDHSFREAIDNFLKQEREHIKIYNQKIATLLPFKSEINQKNKEK